MDFITEKHDELVAEPFLNDLLREAIIAFTRAHFEVDIELLGNFRVVVTPDLEVFFLDAAELFSPILNHRARLFNERESDRSFVTLHES